MSTNVHTPALAERLARLSPEQRRLLEQRLAKPPFPPRHDPSSAPLTSSQRRLWFLNRYEPDSSVYHMPRAFEITGPLDIPALESALTTILRRHEPLRTTFPAPDGEPIQQILPPYPVTLPVLDLNPDEEEAWIAREVARPIHLQRDPVFRALLVRTAPGRHILLIVRHHIISDLVSDVILDREISTLYRGETLPDLPISFGDYAQAEASTPSPHDDFWRKTLAGAPALLDLPLDHPRPAVRQSAGRMHVAPVPPEVSARVRALAAQWNTTPFRVFLAAYALLLARYSGQDDLVIAVPVTGRGHPHLENLIGFFINTLPVRLNVAQASFEALAAHARAVFSAAMAAAQPLDRILDIVRPERSTAYPPLFQAALNYLKPGAPLTLAGASVRRLPVHNGGTPFDLTLNVYEEGAGHRLQIEYAAALFVPATIERLAGHLIRILDAATLDVCLPGPAEAGNLIFERNRTEAPLAPDACVTQWFDRQAIETPDAPAIVFNGATWTYRTLAAHVTRYASAIRAAGASRATLLANRTPETIAAILAIWKAGAIHIPLDPEWPEARRQFVLEGSGASLLIDAQWLETCPEPATPAEFAPVEPNSTAYIFYTSGSTGQPKGVMVPHRALANLLQSVRARPGFGPSDTLAAVTPFTFDVSLAELFLPLTTGGKLILLPREATRDGRALIAAAAQATVITATPATWRLMFESGWTGSPRLAAWCTGEAMPPEVATGLLPRCREVWNLYGPTETTVWSTIHQVRHAEAPMPIGTPVANTACYVLHPKTRQLAPTGVPGELYIGGLGVATGYAGRDDLTAERFLPDPFRPGGRIYATGDLVRWRRDGQLVYQGRLDTQVKVRGNRIELAEVEAALAALPGVRQCAVIADGDRLIAYATVDSNSRDISTFRQALATRLPDYMIPSVFVPLESFPVTGTGKIDRKSLPQPTAPAPRPKAPGERAEEEYAYVESRLRGLWEELLGVSDPGLDTSFFDAGGHSLLAARLFSRMEETFGTSLPLATIFQAPTIRLLGRALRQTGRDRRWDEVTPIETRGHRPNLFCLATLSALSYRALSRDLGPDFPIYGIQPPGQDGSEPPQSTVEGLAQRAVEAMRLIQPRGPYHLLGYSLSGLTAYEAARILVSEGEEVAYLAILDTGPLGLGRYRASLPWTQRLPIMAFRQVAHAIYRARHPRRFLNALRAPKDPPQAWPAPIRAIAVAQQQAPRTYLPGPYGASLLLVRTVDRPAAYSPTYGWENLVAGPITTVDMPGVDHLNMLEEGYVHALAEIIQRTLPG